MSLAGHRDANLLILDKMDDRTLLSYCKTNRYAENLCKNEDFWRNRFIKVHGIEAAKLKDKNRTWKNYYLLVLYYTNKYTVERALEKVAEKGYIDLFNLFSKGMRDYSIKSAVINSGNKDLIYKLDSIDNHLRDVGTLIASRKGDKELINFFLSKGARPSYVLIGALQGNHLDLFQEFSKTQEIPPEDGLRHSSYAGNKDLMQLFISRGATDWNDALGFASIGGQKDAVNFLIEKGANNWQAGLNGAAEGEHPSLIDFFISKGANITDIVKISAGISGNKDIIAYIEKLRSEGY